jgi:hypothetical protein
MRLQRNSFYLKRPLAAKGLVRPSIEVTYKAMGRQDGPGSSKPKPS